MKVGNRFIYIIVSAVFLTLGHFRWVCRGGKHNNR